LTLGLENFQFLRVKSYRPTAVKVTAETADRCGYHVLIRSTYRRESLFYVSRGSSRFLSAPGGDDSDYAPADEQHARRIEEGVGDFSQQQKTHHSREDELAQYCD
jgi:hypothetical protein